jgi:hypothetical protein
MTRDNIGLHGTVEDQPLTQDHQSGGEERLDRLPAHSLRDMSAELRVGDGADR